MIALHCLSYTPILCIFLTHVFIHIKRFDYIETLRHTRRNKNYNRIFFIPLPIVYYYIIDCFLFECWIVVKVVSNVHESLHDEIDGGVFILHVFAYFG
ncbi:Uncharacterized protein FWK35_00004071 [Aphis craccivora]|uniref:Uncharacterized protein n=1 Tax=Aphis craccivora TaxID=307492 RepID=A0A6G0ZQR9_APHCR|nr:Uncharacterized protein FWK35_00004071 [Aphis craccivora]